MSVETDGGHERFVRDDGHWTPMHVGFEDPEAKVAVMDARGIDIAVVSVTPVVFWPRRLLGEPEYRWSSTTTEPCSSRTSAPRPARSARSGRQAYWANLDAFFAGRPLPTPVDR